MRSSGRPGLPAAARPRRRATAVAALLADLGLGLRGVGHAFLAFGHRGDDLMGHHVLARARPEHQLEQHALLELLDGVDGGPAFVPPDGPGGEDAARRHDVDAKGGITDPALPDRLTYWFVHPFSLLEPTPRAWAQWPDALRMTLRERDPLARGSVKRNILGR